MDRPVSNPNLYSLPATEYNKCLQDTFEYFKHKTVKLKDGRIGTVVGVDPRPMINSVPTTAGQDGNWLVIRVPKDASKPGRTPDTNAWAMPDDVEIVEKPSPKEKELKT
jgi:hypothetical protein